MKVLFQGQVDITMRTLFVGELNTLSTIRVKKETRKSTPILPLVTFILAFTWRRVVSRM